MENNKIIASILIVAVLNLMLTLFLIMELRTSESHDKKSITYGGVDQGEVKHITDMLVEKYNEGDGLAIYNMFDDKVKVKMDTPQLFSVLNKLKATIGTISLYSFSHSQKVGEDPEGDIYNIFYDFKSEGAIYTKGTIKVTVIDKDNENYRLYGFFMNGQDMAN